MIFPENLEEKIGFEQVRQLLLQAVLSPLGASYVQRMRWTTDPDILEHILKQAKEFKELLEEDQPFPADNYLDAGSSFSRMKLEGAWLKEDEFFVLLKMLHTTAAIFRYFGQRPDRYPSLQKLFKDASFNERFIKSISAVIDEEGQVRPNASGELASLSREIGDKEREVRRKLNTIYKKAQDAGWTAESGITIRNDRLVIPLLAEHKRKLKGFVHDESATSQTYYIEPAEVFDLHNNIRELQLARRREIEKILRALTDELRPHVPELEMYSQKLGIVDFIRAKAMFALRIRAGMPQLQKQPGIHLVNAHHPLLWLLHQKNGKSVVPLTLKLDAEERILAISGPNAGGKSVCMKTVALLQYMLQCGLLIPAEPHSVCGIFQDMFVDIGDDQSLENDLSTYSSHLQHMKYFMDHAGRKSLFFIDEFGTGTDPQFGGPIAESVLLQLVNKQAFGVITTHYSNIKTFANNTKGMLNASMLFDSELMQPLYILETGKPGSSHAFEIAQRSGFSKHVLDYARARSGHKQLNVDDLLLELQQERIEIHRLRTELENRDAELGTLMSQYRKKDEEISSQKRELLLKAKQEALHVLQDTNSLIENTIRSIRESKADPAGTKQLRESLKERTEALKKDIAEQQLIRQPEKVKAIDPGQTIAVGSWVRIRDSSNTGQVISIKKNKAVIGIGELHSTVELDRLELAPAPAKESSREYKVTGLDMTEKYRGFNSELRLIGERGEEAIRQLKLFIDEAYLLGFKNLRILHGKGDGILRRLVTEELKKNELVLHFSEAHIESGGAGATMVEIR